MLVSLNPDRGARVSVFTADRHEALDSLVPDRALECPDPSKAGLFNVTL